MFLCPTLFRGHFLLLVLLTHFYHFSLSPSLRSPQWPPSAPVSLSPQLLPSQCACHRAVSANQDTVPLITGHQIIMQDFRSGEVRGVVLCGSVAAGSVGVTCFYSRSNSLPRQLALTVADRLLSSHKLEPHVARFIVNIRYPSLPLWFCGIWSCAVIFTFVFPLLHLCETSKPPHDSPASL